MKNRKSNGSSGGAGLIFGILFIVLGVFMLFMQPDAPLMIIIIAAADVLFGLILGISALIGGKNPQDDDSSEIGDADDAPETDNGDADTQAVSADQEEDSFDTDIAPDDLSASEPEVAEQENAAVAENPQEKLERLSKKEAELKAAAREAVAQAKQAKEEAEKASEAAKDAEDKLIAAEQETRLLAGAEQQAALARVDRLASKARELSQQASIAKQNAKTTAALARKAADEHNAAMEEAAQAMMELEEMELSQSSDL